MRGARWVQKEVLNRFPSARLRVYTVWQPILLTDFRFARSESLLDDPRVVHLWDRNKAVGRWFARYRGPQGNCFIDQDVAWDLFYLFGPEAQWRESPGPLEVCGGPVIEASGKLAAGVGRLLGAEPGAEGERGTH